jgi:hypothetical protein
LDSVDKDFLMYLWCELLDQAELTINHLRHYHLNPSISAYEGIYGKKFDFLAHPIHPPRYKGPRAGPCHNSRILGTTWPLRILSWSSPLALPKLSCLYIFD